MLISPELFSKGKEVTDRQIRMQNIIPTAQCILVMPMWPCLIVRSNFEISFIPREAEHMPGPHRGGC